MLRSLQDYDYDKHTFHTLINGPDQKSMFTGMTTELSYLSIHNTERAPISTDCLALNARLDDGKLDMVVITLQSVRKTKALLRKAKSFADDPSKRWYSSKPSVIYLKPEEANIKIESPHKVYIDGQPTSLDQAESLKISCVHGLRIYALPRS